jgi:GR25 family glycosyltransferase involved in LPS biosynthesis
MFQRIECLSLDKRIDEQERITAEFSAYGMKVNFFVAGEGKLLLPEQYNHIDIPAPANRYGYTSWVDRPNSYNAFLCFKKIVQRAKDDNLENILICEDDVSLTPLFGKVFPKVVNELERHKIWNMLYLGANHTWAKTEEVSPHLLRLKGGTVCWHCVALHKSIFDTILSLPLVSPIDAVCAQLVQPHYVCFAAWPTIAIQRPCHSYCEDKFVDYQHYFYHKGNT